MPGRRAGIPARTSRCILDPTPADSWTTPRSDRRESRLSSCRVDRCTYTLCRRNTPHYISHSQFFVCAAVFSYLLSSVTYSLFCILVKCMFFYTVMAKSLETTQKTENWENSNGYWFLCVLLSMRAERERWKFPLTAHLLLYSRSPLRSRPATSRSRSFNTWARSYPQ